MKPIHGGADRIRLDFAVCHHALSVLTHAGLALKVLSKTVKP